MHGKAGVSCVWIVRMWSVLQCPVRRGIHSIQICGRLSGHDLLTRLAACRADMAGMQNGYSLDHDTPEGVCNQ